MKIYVAEQAGFCFGVKRAYNLAVKAAKEEKKSVYTLGPLIHNPQVVERLKNSGVEVLEDPQNAMKGTMIIRSHGAPPHVFEKAKKLGIDLIDATCPFVKKAQKCAQALEREGYEVLLVGDKEHPEVKSIVGHLKQPAMVVGAAEELSGWKIPRRVGIIAQTTQSVANFNKIVGIILEKAHEIKIFNTICNSTINRIESARILAQKVDVMLIVGGKNSANTTRLAQVVKEVLPQSYHVEVPEEIDPRWLEGKERVGISAGASTPDWIISAVITHLQSLAGAKEEEVYLLRK